MATAVDIANQALDMLGAGPINDFDEQSAPAQRIKRNYDTVRKELLSTHPWSFALKTSELVGTALTNDPDFGNSFVLPADYLIISTLNGVSEDTVQWKRRGSSIFINTSELVIEYVWDIADTIRYPALFSTALAYALASRIAYATTKKESVALSMLQGFFTAASIARGSDGNEQKLENTIGTSFVTVRS